MGAGLPCGSVLARVRQRSLRECANEAKSQRSEESTQRGVVTLSLRVSLPLSLVRALDLFLLPFLPLSGQEDLTFCSELTRLVKSL